MWKNNLLPTWFIIFYNKLVLHIDYFVWITKVGVLMKCKGNIGEHVTSLLKLEEQITVKQIITFLRVKRATYTNAKL